MTRHEQLVELTVTHGYREKTVADWSEERIQTVLESRRRERRNDLHRADSRNTAVDGGRGTASKLERQITAAYLEQALAEPGDGIVNALLYCGWCLTGAEVRGLALELVAKLREEL